MTLLQDLPGHVVELLCAGRISEFATISAAGVPINTPSLYFPSEGLRSFDFSTGLAYPAKAERARRNPRVGLLIEGGPEEPIISIAGMAAVRDSNLQANAERYLSEAAYTLPGNPDWSLARQAVWYWTRILIEVHPVRVLWWDNAAGLDAPPQRWEAAHDSEFPPSDPLPPGAASSASHWRKPSWREQASVALSRGANGHLTLIDAQGFPMPFRAHSIALSDEGFTMALPRSAPWPIDGSVHGKANLSFQGVESFVGEVSGCANEIVMRVDRALPQLPTMLDMRELWEPSPATYEEFMKRLTHETRRRGVPLPTIPAERPAPTEYYKLRMARQAAAPRPRGN